MSLIQKSKGSFDTNTKIEKNFSLGEFACKHCGDLLIYTELTNKLQDLREKINSPITITSGYRCSKNIPANSSSTSLHSKGRAVDFQCYRKKLLLDVFKIAVNIFPRCGIYMNADASTGYMHVDIGVKKLYWVYNTAFDRKYKYFSTPGQLLAFCIKDRYLWSKALI